MRKRYQTGKIPLIAALLPPYYGLTLQSDFSHDGQMTSYSPGAAESLGPLLNGQAQSGKHAQTEEQMRNIVSEMGRVMTQCTMAAITDDRTMIVRTGAEFMNVMIQLWDCQGIDASAIWAELHCRIELGELYHRLNQVPGRFKGPRRGMAHIATSKLP